MNSKEKLVVEVVRARNLMPKDGKGSSSAFVEVEFENQRQRTQVKRKDLNPVWKEKLVFNVNDVAELRYRAVEINVFNERKSGSNRNFLGKVRISCSNIVREVEEIAQLYTLEKRSLFSNVRGEISLKLYLSTKEQTKKGNGNEAATSSTFVKKPNNMHLQATSGSFTLQPQQQQRQQQKQLTQDNKWPQPPRQQSKPVEPNPSEIKPVVFTTGPGPSIRTSNIVGVGGGGGGTGGFSSSGLNEFTLKETSPHLGGEPTKKDKTSSTYDLVEQMMYLYVRVVKGRVFSIFGGGEVVAEVKLGNYRGLTKRASLSNPEWNQVFAFSKDSIQSSMVEIFVKENNKDDYLGRIWFDLNEVPKRVPPDSQLAPQWYRMEDKKGEKTKGGEVMVSVWFGTQTDEAFAEAWHSKSANVHFDGICSIKSKVYLSPKLWYLRVTIIEAQDIVPVEKGSTMAKFSELSAKAQVGNQVLKTRVAPAMANRTLSNPFWNEDLMFVVAEPFEDYLMLSVENRIGPGRDNILGRVLIPVKSIERRLGDEPTVSKWFTLDTHYNNMGLTEPKVVTRFGSRIHLRLSLDGGYHVLDESTMYSSDVRPTAKQLWKPQIGALEMGILGATGLTSMKIKQGKGGSTDAYCVAKYGQKWVRTRTVIDSLAPKWNEQYSWEVFDPCTIITIGVFDNSHTDKSAGAGVGARDSLIGKIRIRLSTLESNRVYTHSYPLLMLHTSGVKKMGELHLAIRFTCANMANVLHMYPLPLLPRMHYVLPLSVNQLESLRYQAMNVVATRLSRAEPPLGREVVEYMLDHGSHMWSMRRSKANFFRIVSVLSTGIALWKWVESVRNWQKPVHTVLFVVFFLVLDIFPELILPFIFLCLSLTGLWRYPWRPRHPPHMDTRLSCAETVYGDELDEEFDTFPTRRSADIVRVRYDRLRSVAGRIQSVVGDLATQSERLQALLSWRDPRATVLFMVVCLVVAVGFYAVPFRVVVGFWGLYALRPPRFKSKLPSPALSFFRRLPSKADTLL
ncbi:FT-interacting protein 3-like [Telopea speciosissima]|uniref:FT-interacting protein 3-like n=1 Tax=Telopea speciosissima TaxID=54955 RepID=UPI001CC7308C|nr:FT-interacting protein 3-like [Telopea speciosissima]